LTRKSDLRKHFAETPQADAANPVSIKLVFKLPTGTRIERVFLKSDPVGLVYKFVFCHEECPHSFEIVKNFPRQAIECSEATETTINEHGINQPMLLFVNDLDA
jgi:FAS-associated factor 2